MLCADEIRLYINFDMNSMAESLKSLEHCIYRIKNWMLQNLLMLNDGKTEIIYFWISLRVGNCKITSINSVHNLGAYFDLLLNMEEFILKKVQDCQWQIHKIAKIRKYLS